MNRFLHFQRYKLAYETLFIFCYLFINNTILATSVIMEARRNSEVSFYLWVPFVAEYTSAIGTGILLPVISWLLNKYPINWQAIKRTFAVYLFASMVYSLLHTSIMVGLRKIIYLVQSMNYDFGDVFFELGYEYRKDLWAFIFFVMMIKSYQFILSRLQGEANPISDGEDTPIAAKFERLLVKKLGKEFIIKVADIEWLESSGNYVNLHIKGRIYPIRSTLNQLISNISAKGFCRIHRSYAINLDQVDCITPLSSGDSEVTLNNGKVLNLSRRYKDEFKQRLN